MLAAGVLHEHDLSWLLSQPLFWAALGTIGGPYLFFRGFSALRFKRRVMNTPQSTVRGAALGPVVMSGKATGPYTLVAPLSKENCLYYRLVVVEDQERRFSNKVREMCAPLFLDDGTGLQLIYPAGVDLRLAPSHQEGSLGKAMDGYRTGDSPDFVREYSIREGDQIFVVGTLKENVWRQTRRTEVSRIGPGFVSAAEAELARSAVFSCLDPGMPTGEASSRQLEFDLNPPTILMRDKSPFVISDSQPELLTKVGWQSLLFIWGGPLWATWAVWEILTHPEVWQTLTQRR